MDERDNNISNRMNFQDFCKLDQAQRDFFIFDTLCRVEQRTVALDRKFALKWVERVTQSAMVITLVAVFGAILAKVGLSVHSGGSLP